MKVIGLNGLPNCDKNLARNLFLDNVDLIKSKSLKQRQRENLSLIIEHDVVYLELDSIWSSVN